MKVAAGIVLSVLMVTACGSNPDRAAPSVTAASPTPSVTQPSLQDSVAPPKTGADLGLAFPCSSLIGHPFGPIWRGELNGPGCYTGTSGSDDATKFSVTPCNPAVASSRQVVSWGSTDTAAPDQNYYAAYVDGVIVVVPGASPTKRPVIAEILQAVGADACT